MKNHYISNELGIEVYATWLKGKKVVLKAPTGTGKTTFILKVFLKYCSSLGKKVLILCNRKLLKEQYGYDIAQLYVRHAEMEKDVQVMTYQELSEKIQRGCSLENVFVDFSAIVCDEAHYFYADSDFNAWGTYVLLQSIVKAGFYKCMIFITATFEEVYPLIKKCFQSYREKIEQFKYFEGIEEYFWSDQIYDYSNLAEYTRITCHYVPDVETLANIIAESPKKSLIFIDDTKRAESFKKMLVETKKVCDSDVFLLNSKIMEESKGNEIILNLAINGRILPKILITTSVLDNGVSIHDQEVDNIVIATEAKVSFVQMLGRVRAESNERCNLYIYPRGKDYFRKRIEQNEEKMRLFRELELKLRTNKWETILYDAWYGNDEESEFIRNAIVITKEALEYYSEEKVWGSLRKGDITLAVNEFSKEKTGNQLNRYKEFFKLALMSKEAVAIKQISWLGKSEDELIVNESSYLKEREEGLIRLLSTIDNYNNEELQKVKEKIAKEYRRDVLIDFALKNSSFSTEKLALICERYGLKLEKAAGNNKKMTYNVVRKLTDD